MNPGLRWHACSLCILSLGLGCRDALSEEKDAPTAEALFRAGREAAGRGDDETACERFGESYRLDAAAGTLLNIAACKEALHHLAEAWESYRHVAEALPPGDDRLPLVRERIEELDTRLPRLTIHAEGGALPGQIARDGAALNRAALDVALPMDPGPHRIVVRAPGRSTREYVVVLDEGQRLLLAVAPGEVSTTAATPRSSPGRIPATSPGSLRRNVEYALFGAGIASAIGASVALGLYLDAAATADGNCPTHATCNDEGLRAAGAAERLGTLTWVFGTAALATLGGGVALALTEASAPPGAEKRSARIVVGFGSVKGELQF